MLNFLSIKKAVHNLGQMLGDLKKKIEKKRKRMRKVNATAPPTTCIFLKYAVTFIRFCCAVPCRRVHGLGPTEIHLCNSSVSLGSSRLHCVYAARSFFSPEPLSVSIYDAVSHRVTVNTVRHRKQVDNNESDCGKSVCTQDQSFSCPVAFFLPLSPSFPACCLSRHLSLSGL